MGSLSWPAFIHPFSGYMQEFLSLWTVSESQGDARSLSDIQLSPVISDECSVVMRDDHDTTVRIVNRGWWVPDGKHNFLW